MTPREATEVGMEIQNQIPTWLRFAVGYRHGQFLMEGDGGLRFSCKGRGHYTVTVELDRAMDTYNVAVATKNGLKSRVFYTHNGAYTDDMVEIVNNIDRGVIKAS